MTLGGVASQIALGNGRGVFFQPDDKQALRKRVRSCFGRFFFLIVVLQHQHVHQAGGRLGHEPPLLHILVDGDP